jgi:hypothetical protein
VITNVLEEQITSIFSVEDNPEHHNSHLHCHLRFTEVAVVSWIKVGRDEPFNAKVITIYYVSQNEIWKIAKCVNFITREISGQFHT